jgi:hypothetical protein
MSEQPDAAELIAALPCTVELPENWADYFTRSGPLPTVPDDGRRFPRFYLRTAAALGYRSTLPCLTRPAGAHRVYLKDISRSSVAFVHSEQLFPCECFEMLLVDGTHWFVTVVRCVRRHERCYEVAAMLTAKP